jgi:hypothetical protein
MTRSLMTCAVLILIADTVEATEILGTPPTPNTDSIEREASRLSQRPPKPTRQDAAWAHVQSIKAGTAAQRRSDRSPAEDLSRAAGALFQRERGPTGSRRPLSRSGLVP